MDDQIHFVHTNITLLREPEAIRKLAVLAGKIAYYNFEWRYVALLMFNTVQAIGVETFMKNFGKSAIMELGEFIPRHRVPVPQFVLFYEKTSEIQHYIEWVVKAGYENTGKFIVVCMSTDRSNCDEEAVLKTCIKMIVVNVIFLRIDDANNPVGFTYWPVRANQCYDTSPVKIDVQWDSTNVSSFLDMYPDKLCNLHLCPINVSTFEQHPFMYLNNLSQPRGLDGNLLLIIMHALNATFKIVQPAEDSWGDFQNNTWTGAVGEVFNGRAHIAMCSAPLTFSKLAKFQISSMYNSMDMIWISTMPPERPTWEKLMYPLKIYIRITLFLMFILIAALNSALKTKLWSTVRRILSIAPPRSNLLFSSWMIFLGLAVSKMPKKVTLLIMVYQWVWFSFIIRNVYQGTLIGSLKHPAYEEGLQNFEDILRTQFPFGGSVILKEYYSEDREIYDRWTELSFNMTYVVLEEMTLGDSPFFLAWSKEMMVEYMLHFNGTRQLRALPEKIVNSPTVIFLRKYSPLTQPLNRVLSHLTEGGFTDRSYARYVQSGSRFIQRKSNNPEPLRMSHFNGPAAILFVGWFTSFLFFTVELFSDWFEKRMRVS